MDLSLVFGRGRTLLVRCYCYWSAVSVNHDVGLSCIQWRASNRHGKLPSGVDWSSWSYSCFSQHLTAAYRDDCLLFIGCRTD